MKLQAEPLRIAIERWVGLRSVPQGSWDATTGKNIRWDSGIGQIDNLAVAAGVSVKTVSRIRYGSELVTLDVADRLCMALGEHLSILYPLPVGEKRPRRSAGVLAARRKAE